MILNIYWYLMQNVLEMFNELGNVAGNVKTWHVEYISAKLVNNKTLTDNYITFLGLGTLSFSE